MELLQAAGSGEAEGTGHGDSDVVGMNQPLILPWGKSRNNASGCCSGRLTTANNTTKRVILGASVVVVLTVVVLVLGLLGLLPEFKARDDGDDDPSGSSSQLPTATNSSSSPAVTVGQFSTGGAHPPASTRAPLPATFSPPSASGPFLPCPLRPLPGSRVRTPSFLRSVNGTLAATFHSRSTPAAAGEDSNTPRPQGSNSTTTTTTSNVVNLGWTQYCFESGGVNGPTLRMWPGDKLLLTLQNEMAPDLQRTSAVVMPAASACGSNIRDKSSTNVHFHGMNISPKCHRDEIVYTLINSGDSFTYNISLALDITPGFYWYHPHVMEATDIGTQGGASGAIIVEGIEQVYPAVAGLPEVLLLIRDQPRPQPQVVTASGKPAVVQLPTTPSRSTGDNSAEAPLTAAPTSTLSPAMSSTGPSTPSSVFTTAATLATTPTVPDASDPAGPPAWDLSVNYVPILYPEYIPATLDMPADMKMFWRVGNLCADANLELQLEYDGVPQVLELVARDGVPLDPKRPVLLTSLPLLTASRYEFIALSPKSSVRLAQIITRKVDTGVDGDSNPQRPLVNIFVPQDTRVSTNTSMATVTPNSFPGVVDPRTLQPLVLPNPLYFTNTSNTTDTGTNSRSSTLPQSSSGGQESPPSPESSSHSTESIVVYDPEAYKSAILSTVPVANRSLYFSEIMSIPGDPKSPTVFFITVKGSDEEAFSPTNLPALVATQGTVEDWYIENRSQELHTFHIHQIHFLLLERNGVPVNATEQLWMDTVPVPAWDNSADESQAAPDLDNSTGIQVPSVKVRLDFSGDIVGETVYHCHILEHEDNGMMAILRILPAEPV